jgi:kynurenine formamidase
MDRVLLLTEHTGTHVDAPYHMLAEGEAIDRLGLERFYGPAVLADVSDRDPGIAIDQESIEAALCQNGLDLLHDDMLIVRCWSEQRDDPGFTSARGFLPEVGPWLVEKGIKALGVDLPYVDHPADRSFPVHIALFRAGIPIYENLTCLDQLPKTRFTFVGLPLPLTGGGGSPVRAMAIVDRHGKE